MADVRAYCLQTDSNFPHTKCKSQVRDAARLYLRVHHPSSGPRLSSRLTKVPGAAAVVISRSVSSENKMGCQTLLLQRKKLGRSARKTAGLARTSRQGLERSEVVHTCKDRGAWRVYLYKNSIGGQSNERRLEQEQWRL